MRLDGWNRLKSFAKVVVDSFPPSKNGTHIGFVTYGDQASVDFNFDFKPESWRPWFDRDSMKRYIDNIQYRPRGERRIDNALDVTNRDLFSQSGGSRPNARKVHKLCILLNIEWSTRWRPSIELRMYFVDMRDAYIILLHILGGFIS